MRPKLTHLRLNDRRSIDTAVEALSDGNVWSVRRLSFKTRWCWRRAKKALLLVESMGWARQVRGGWVSEDANGKANL